MESIKKIGQKIAKSFWKFAKDLFLPQDPQKDKQLLDKVKKLEQELIKLKQKANSPEQYHAMSKKVQRQFVEYVGSLKFSQAIPNKKGIHICFIGPTSVGKSTLYNNLYNLGLQVGLGSCTDTAVCIHNDQQNDLHYWDAPGINKNFSFYTMKHLAFFSSLDVIFVLFDRDVDDVHLIIQIFAKMNKKMLFVRTKCDLYKEGFKRTIQEELERDKEQIKQYYPGCVQVIPVGLGMFGKIQQAIDKLKN